jgi:sec-independent protein translocase protein TatA
MPFAIQPWHIVIVVLVALIVFGPAKLPELGRTIGKTINDFRVGAREMTETMKDEISRPDPKVIQTESTFPVQMVVTPPLYAASQPVSESVPAVAIPASGSFCVQCGTPNPVDARFCKSCGKQLVA